MSELDDFRATVLARQTEAERAIHAGDPEPRMALWSRHDPVTLFGAAGQYKAGWQEVSRVFRRIAGQFSDVSDYRYDVEVVDISGDMAYTVGFERYTGSTSSGVPVEPVTLRVTHVYRRENGEWKIVHRHGDHAPAGPAS